jgi:hypothetical protein
VRTTAESLEIPVSIIYSHLVEKIGRQNFLLRWVPHTLTNELRQKRVELSNQLLWVLESQQRVGFRDIVTGGESWLLQHYDHREIWCKVSFKPRPPFFRAILRDQIHQNEKGHVI